MSYFQDLADDHADLSYSPLLRVARLTLQYTQDHGPIGLTKTAAFKRAFFKWAAEHFDWSSMSHMDAKRHLIRFVATTNHKSRIMGALLSRFRDVDLTPPSNLDWEDRAKTILEAEGLTPERDDVVQMLQSFQGTARDLLEETVMASKAVMS